MKTEIDYAVNFLVTLFKEKLSLSEEQLTTLQKRLPELLQQRYENHWYTDKPMKGSAFRCINVSVEDNSVDNVLRTAAEDIGLTTNDLLKVFDKGLALWVDPIDVSCRLGKGAIFPIYKKITETKSKKVESPVPVSVPGSMRRPQQRPRSTSPPHDLSYNQIIVSRPRSTTPPGFSAMDAGKMYKNIPTSLHYSSDNLHKVWDSIPNSTSQTNSQFSHQTPSGSLSTLKYAKNNDSSYSFNQYSSYYNPNAWKKNTRAYVPPRQPKALWQDDVVYQKYHWSRNDNTTATNLSYNQIPSYSYGVSRQAQEVC